MSELLIVIVGMIIGTIASLVGIGGGVFFVPILYFIFHLEIHECVGTSLFAILFLSSSAFLQYSKQKKVNYKIALLLEVPTATGAYLASLATANLPAFLIRALYALVLYVIALSLLRSVKQGKSVEETVETAVPTRRILFGMLISFLVGLIAGTTGISGGVVKTPIMIIVLGLPTKIAVGTSSLMVFFTSLAGVLGHMQAGQIRYSYGFLLGMSAAIGAQVGTRLSRRTKGKTIRLILAIILIIVASNMLLN